MLKQAVLSLKYRDGWRLADALAELLASRLRDGAHGRMQPGDAVAGDVPWWKGALVVGVPIDRERESLRAYSQSMLLSSRLAVRLGLRHRPAILRRCADGVVQSKADCATRHEQVRGIFEAHGKLDGVRVLLVDDVMTTAATIDAAASALCQRGARVCAAVVARQAMRRVAQAGRV